MEPATPASPPPPPPPARRTLRIAQVSPLYESVPPLAYGGTERIVSYLTEALVTEGHRVTLFASPDSHTAAELISCWDRALRLDEREPDAAALHLAMFEDVKRRADGFDVIHFHTDKLHLPLTRRIPTPSLTTLHGRLDLAGLELLYREFREHPLVSISDAQRGPLPSANWVATVHHGLPLTLYSPTTEPGRYLAFIGRVAPEKGLDRAISLAHGTGIPLKIAAKVDRADKEYFDKMIKPHIDGSFIEYVGEIREHEKTRFLGDAAALVFLIDWPEPFGLAMIEAMACGTPVIARRRGSVPEVVDQGITGFIVEDLHQAVRDVPLALELDRRRCREQFERRFSATRLARDYLAIYRSLGGSE